MGGRVRRERFPWLGRRLVLYSAAVVVVGSAFVWRSDDVPPLPLLVGLVLTITVANMLPTGVGTIEQWRSRMIVTQPPLVMCGLMLPWSWAVLVWATGAVLSGYYVRIYRTTPGRMLVGASRVTLDAAAGCAVMGMFAADQPAQVVVAAVLGCLVSTSCGGLIAAVVDAPHRGLRTRSALRWMVPKPSLRFTSGVSLGAAAVVLGTIRLELTLLVALPYVAMLIGAAHSTRVHRERERLDELVALSRQLHRATSADEVIDQTAVTVERLLGARVHLGTPPQRRDAGAKLETAGGSLWIVAEERYGPPTYEGRFHADERRLMEVIAAVASSALETMAIMEQAVARATFDPLTGVANRSAIGEHLERELARAERDGTEVGLVFVDVDRFKSINDTYGHSPVGDAVLVEVARRLKSVLRAGDRLGRWGGEEFLAVIVRTGGPGLVEVAERLRAAVGDSPVSAGGHQIPVSVSVGVATSAGHGSTASLLTAADQALLAAKEAGKDRVVAAG